MKISRLVTRPRLKKPLRGSVSLSGLKSATSTLPNRLLWGTDQLTWAGGRLYWT